MRLPITRRADSVYDFRFRHHDWQSGCARPRGLRRPILGNIWPGDTQLAAVHITPSVPPTRVDRTGEFIVSARKAGVISNTSGTNTTGGFLLVAWDKTE